jgi:hypothetical protein
MTCGILRPKSLSPVPSVSGLKGRKKVPICEFTNATGALPHALTGYQSGGNWWSCVLVWREGLG